MIWFMGVWHVLLFVAIALVISFFYGYFLRRLIFDRVLDLGVFLPGEMFFLTVVLGHFGILLLMMVISIFRLIDKLLLCVITLGVVGYSVLRFYGEGRRFSELLSYLKRDFTFLMLFMFLIVGIFYYFGPVFIKHIANYPGGDDKAYIFTTVHILRNKGFSLDFSYYPYASFHGHVFVCGFSLFAIFFLSILNAFLLEVSITAVHLFLVLYFRALTSISFYLFVKKFTGNIRFSASVAVACIFLCHSYLLFFYWGGIGESLGYLLVPLLLVIDYDFMMRVLRWEGFWRVYIFSFLVRFVFVVVLILCHVYSAILFIFSVTIIGLCYLREEAGKKGVLFAMQYMIMYLIGSVLVIAVLPFLSEELRSNLLGIFAWDVEDVLRCEQQKLWSRPYLVFSRDLEAMLILTRFMSVFTNYFGWYLLPMVLFDVVVLAWGRRVIISDEEVRRFVGVVGLTFIALFLFSQNNPFGLYYIPYVGAVQIYVVRMYYPIEMLSLIFKGLFIYLVWGVVVSLIRSGVSILSGLRYKDIAVFIFTCATFVLILMGLIIGRVGGLRVSSYKFYYDVYISSANEAVITRYDIIAFEWIKENVPEDAIFCVNPSDAGPFIYVITGRVILPPYSLRLWTFREVRESFSYILNGLIIGNVSERLIHELAKFGVDYIYVGAKTQYGHLKFNVTALEVSPFFIEVFSYGPVKIFKVNYSLLKLQGTVKIDYVY